MNLQPFNDHNFIQKVSSGDFSECFFQTFFLPKFVEFFADALLSTHGPFSMKRKEDLQEKDQHENRVTLSSILS